jgi:hypothetical protein
LSSSDGDSDDEEGVILHGNSGLATETVYLDPNEVCDDEQISKIMGFSGFDSTKAKPVEDNHQGAALGAVSKHRKRIYRQYMNRRGTSSPSTPPPLL